MEKLTIEERKIIQILLKNLMDLKNENAFLKNKLALHTLDNDIPESKVGAKQLYGGIPKDDLGGIQLNKGIPKDDLGVIQLNKGIPKDDLGVIQLNKGIPKDDLGVIQLNKGMLKDDLGGIQLNKGIPKDDLGVIQLNKGILKDDLGVIQLKNVISENNIGGISVTEAQSKLITDDTGSVLLYKIFEKWLRNALEDYIRNGDGHNTLYTFYNDFEDAVNEQNSAAAKSKEAAANANLEDTHSLPKQLNSDKVAIIDFSSKLKGTLARRADRASYKTVAKELLLLHNAGKATSSELRGFSGLSVKGFEKHLQKLLRYNLIKKQAPSNYILTDKSNRILLELFGVPKN